MVYRNIFLLCPLPPGSLSLRNGLHASPRKGLPRPWGRQSPETFSSLLKPFLSGSYLGPIWVLSLLTSSHFQSLPVVFQSIGMQDLDAIFDLVDYEDSNIVETEDLGTHT